MPDDAVWSYLEVVLHNHTLEPLDFVGHGTVSPLKSVKHCVDTVHSLFS